MYISKGTASHGEWNDHLCSQSTHTFVCERYAELCPATVVSGVDVLYKDTHGGTVVVDTKAEFCCSYVGAVVVGSYQATCLANSSWSSRPPVCTIPSSEECGSNGWTPWNNNCYKLFATLASWTDAELSCVNQSGHLVSIHNGDDNSLVSGLAFSQSPNADVWIGLIAKGGKYNWSDGTAFTYNQWRQSISPPQSGIPTCSYSDSSQKWSVSECGIKKPFVCKRPAEKWYCKEWAAFGGYCYKYISTRLTWHAAAASCANMSSQLLIIENRCEGEFVHKLTTNVYWIGLTDSQNEGTFLWINGQVPVYTNFAPGEPNNFSTNVIPGEDCVAAYSSVYKSGLWNDYHCSVIRLSYVCKKAQRCPSLLPLRNGWVVSDDVTVDSVANYSCHDGYFMVGESNRSCQYDGTWTGHPPSCQIKDCGPLAVQGVRVVAENTTFGSSARFFCNVGYQIQGQPTSNCTSNGTWTRPFPKCTSRTIVY
jgi:hypothetical protein